MDAVDPTVVSHPAPSTLHVLSHPQYSTPDSLSPHTVSPNPLTQFDTWFAHALAHPVSSPEAMTLSTSTPSGHPSARIVLLKALDPRGFLFYTNYTSRKSSELSQNPHCALVFYWPEIHRSIRIVGTAEKVSREDSTAYFNSRPLGSRLGAWASRQSSVVEEGEVSQRLERIKERFGVADAEAENADIPPPDFWGGWRVVPTELEFWSGKPSRLHDRVRYLRISALESDSEPEWKIERLAP